MILVTGASGFLGRHLLQALSQGTEPVRALFYHQNNFPKLENVTWFQTDLLDVYAVEDAMDGVDRVYHCAATVSFDVKDKRRLIRDNVAIVENVVNAALDANVSKFLHVSSVAALGRKKNMGQTQLIDEDCFLAESEHHSHYAVGKYYGEMEVWRGIAEGLNAVVVNPSIILGAGDWTRGSAHLMQICYDEFPWYTNGATGWVDVDDVVKAMLLLMDSDISAERFILNGHNATYKTVFSLMAKNLNKKPPHRLAPKWIAEMVWRWSYLKNKLKGSQATITKETARNAQQAFVFDNHKFLKHFPDFRYTPIEATIQQMAKLFLVDIKRAK